MPSSVRMTHLPVDRFPNNLDTNIPNNMLTNPSLGVFYFILIVSLIPLINKPVYRRDITIFMMSTISSFKECFV